MLQKLAHRDNEQVTIKNSPHDQSASSQKSVKRDQLNATKVFCQWKWVLGFAFILLNVLCHSLIVPFCDLTLLSCNAATAIIVNMLLSCHVLGEKFIWQYDLTAMTLIAFGSVTIVINAHTEQVEFTADEI